MGFPTGKTSASYRISPQKTIDGDIGLHLMPVKNILDPEHAKTELSHIK